MVFIFGSFSSNNLIDRGLRATSDAVNNVMAIVVCAVSSNSCIIP